MNMTTTEYLQQQREKLLTQLSEINSTNDLPTYKALKSELDENEWKLADTGINADAIDGYSWLDQLQAVQAERGKYIGEGCGEVNKHGSFLLTAKAPFRKKEAE